MDRISFKVNGVEHSVGCEISSDVTLVDYLRNYLELRGTKYMCREGGCGACCVTVVKCEGGPVISVNSCLVSITSCQDWEITTIEKIGNRLNGYHKLQKTLAEYNGTQCGYCTPAWIQNMYSLLQKGTKPTMMDIEKAFGSNICRCTGYRPILEAFKKFGCDAPKESKIVDIEDLKICDKTEGHCFKKKCNDEEDWCIVSDEEVRAKNIIEIALKDEKFWYKVYDLWSIYNILNRHGYDSYMLVYGNTAKGVYPITEYPRILIDITTVPELKNTVLDQNLMVGVGITLNELQDVFKAASKEMYFGYLNKFVEHINLVASIPIKHLGSVGGNLMIKHQHNDFSSDLFLLFETVGAYLTIYTSERELKKLSMELFLREDMKRKLIINVLLPPLGNQYKLVTYKGLLSLCPQSIVNSKYVSGITRIHETRPLSDGRQIFDTNPTLWPLNQPIPKIEALIQCAGETRYTDDLQVHPREVHAAFALSSVAIGDIVNIDASAALKYPGVIAFYKASDIPGVNSFTPGGTPFFEANEEVLASTKVSYFNQPIGIVVGESRNIAELAAKLVTATYTNTKDPITDIKIAKNDEKRNRRFAAKMITDKGTDVVKTITGSNTIYSQFHMMMENISCVTRPTEEGLECHVTSQWIDGCQIQIAKALNIDESKIDVHVRRLGGAFGIKVSRPSQIAVACSLVVVKLNRPCRFVVPLTTCTRAVGKRLPCHTEFECNVNATGVIQSIKHRQYEDNGFMIDESLTLLASDVYNNCYTNTKWDYEVYDTITDTAKNTWCRSPGSLESISMAEYIVERIAYELSLDPFDVRIANVDTEKYSDIIGMAEDLKKSSNYMERLTAVDKFNNENRWKKRGLRCSFLRWSPVGNSILEINLSILHGDGTVILTHGGVEMGQGLNTKAVQICAYYFKIPIDKIQIKGNNTIIAPNCYATGGSIGSQNVGLGVRRVCETMLKRLEPIRSQLNNPSWLELITQAYQANVDLQAHSFVGISDVFTYDIFGVAVAEAEIDVLTGESEILRVDILQDVGQSVSPEIDVGQVEGAFIMGQGYWMYENPIYNRTTGELLSDRTWNYYVPLARDIPQDFRVAFRKKSYSLEPILGAKGTGEPPMCLSIVIAFALRAAVAAAREEIGVPSTSWFDIDGPLTVEQINIASGVRKQDFKFN